MTPKTEHVDIPTDAVQDDTSCWKEPLNRPAYAGLRIHAKCSRLLHMLEAIFWIIYLTVCILLIKGDCIWCTISVALTVQTVLVDLILRQDQVRL